MPRATIEIDGTPGSDTDAAINTLITLSNDDVGDERTYRWEVVDQPAGTADAINTSSGAIATITPRKEGSYLIRLVVDEGLATETTDTQVLAVRQLKTRLRVPAALERTQVHPTTGWAADVDAVLRTVDALRADPGIIVAQAGNALSARDVVAVQGVATIKSGLPGEEQVLTVVDALGTTTQSGLLGIVVSSVAGAASVSSGALAYIRLFGAIAGLSGSPSAGDPVYIADDGTLSLTPGTSQQRIGTVCAASGGTYVMLFTGWPVPTVTDEVDPGTRRWAFQVNPGLTTIGASGTSTAPTTVKTGTLTTTNARGPWIQYTTSASGSSTAGWECPGSYAYAIFQRRWGPRFWAVWEFLGTTADLRIWVGMVSDDPMASATPAESLAAFRYDTAEDGTATFRACTDNGSGTPTVVDTGVVVAESTRYVMEVDASASANVKFRINGVLVATITTTLPADDTTMGWAVQLRRTTGSDAKRMHIARTEGRSTL